MTTRVSRRKERAARRRSLRVQRGGGVDKDQLVTKFNELVPKNERPADVDIDVMLTSASVTLGSIPDTKDGMLALLQSGRGKRTKTPSQQDTRVTNNADDAAAAGANAPEENNEEEVAEAPVSPNASWYSTIPQERKEEWVTAIAGHDNMKRTLGVLLDSEGQNKASAYIELLALQDDVFDVAFKIIGKKLGLGDSIDIDTLLANAQQIKDESPNMIQYIKDAALFITIEEDTVKEGDPTKLQKIIQGETGNPSKENIFELMLFPDRLHNILIKGLANLFVMLKEEKNRNLLKNSNALEILKKQYRAYIEALSLTQTSLPLRDGFYLNQGISNFNDEMGKFWISLIRGLTATPPLSLTDKECNFIGETKWGTISAVIFNLYVSGTFDTDNYFKSLISLFNKTCEGITYIPKSGEILLTSIYKETLFDTTITLETLLTHMQLETFEYMVHLVHAIKKAEQEAKKTGGSDAMVENAPANVTPASVTAQSSSQGT